MRALSPMLVVMLSAASLFAQEPGAGQSGAAACYHARPKPACSVFFLTNAGFYIGSPSARGVADWGVMFNVGQRNAIGASFFAMIDNDGGTAGPALRYRRWLGPRASLDVSLGTAITVSENETGSLYGLVKWNPDHWIGVAARPELIHRSVVTSCGTLGCTFESQRKPRLSLGVEVGWVPGLVVSVAGGAATLVLALALAGVD